MEEFQRSGMMRSLAKLGWGPTVNEDGSRYDCFSKPGYHAGTIYSEASLSFDLVHSSTMERADVIFLGQGRFRMGHYGSCERTAHSILADLKYRSENSNRPAIAAQTVIALGAIGSEVETYCQGWEALNMKGAPANYPKAMLDYQGDTRMCWKSGNDTLMVDFSPWAYRNGRKCSELRVTSVNPSRPPRRVQQIHQAGFWDRDMLRTQLAFLLSLPSLGTAPKWTPDLSDHQAFVIPEQDTPQGVRI
jgi:hypothetical protein